MWRQRCSEQDEAPDAGAHRIALDRFRILCSRAPCVAGHERRDAFDSVVPECGPASPDQVVELEGR